MSIELESSRHAEIDAVDVVRRSFATGQHRWPQLSVDYDYFAASSQRVLEQEGTLPLEASDFYLCCACAQALPEALRLFERDCLPVARTAIRRIDSDENFVIDTLQELWTKLLVGDQARVRVYSGRGPLGAWVRVAATRLALDRKRSLKRSVEREVELTEGLTATSFSPEVELLKARFGDAFRQSLRTALAELTKQERNVLRMHVVGRCSIDEIGRAYDVHRATAARWIERARGKIYDRVRELLSVNQPLTESEFRSLAGLLGAELELSLTLASSPSVVAPPARSES